MRLNRGGRMSDRLVVLHSDDPIAFVADACAAVAGAVNEPHAWQANDSTMAATYAALLRAYVSLSVEAGQEDVQCRIVTHLLNRLDQAERGEIVTPLLEVADRLHAELTRQPEPT
jgi:hypothetical protein